FAPAYHDYILYSDSTTGAAHQPRRHRTRTFVMMGREMGLFGANKRGSKECESIDTFSYEEKPRASLLDNGEAQSAMLEGVTSPLHDSAIPAGVDYNFMSTSFESQ
ncbi:hypothetical protein CYMTET_34799, partial [Cymbomonas tetramitiformis]